MGRALIPLPAGIAALLAVLVYVNSLQNPFVLDDYYLIVENQSIVDIGNIQGLLERDITRPIVNVSYALDTFVWGRIPDRKSVV